MGNEVSTIGGTIATAATSIATDVTMGHVEALNNAVKDCVVFTAKHAEPTTVCHIGETAAHGVATAIVAGVTLGQVDVMNKAVEDCATKTAHLTVKAGGSIVEVIDEVTDGILGIAHVKGGIHYAVGENERADWAMKGGSRTLGTMAGGAVGFVVGGPVGAFVGGAVGGAAMDGIITGIDSAIHANFRPSGYIVAWVAMAQGESPDDVIEGVMEVC